MKASNRILGKVLYGVIGLGSLVALSACGQPNSDTSNAPASDPATSGSPVAEAPATTAPSAEAPTATTSPVADVPAGTENKTLSELAQQATTSGSFTTLAKAAQAAGLTEKSAVSGSYTVFAPTDEAFAALPPGVLDKLLQPENKPALVELLGYHVIPGKVTSTQLKAGAVKTVEGTPVTVKIDSTSNTVTINNAKVTQADIPAKNGVIHVVDKVILPPDIQATLNSNQPAQ